MPLMDLPLSGTLVPTDAPNTRPTVLLGAMPVHVVFTSSSWAKVGNSVVGSNPIYMVDMWCVCLSVYVHPGKPMRVATLPINRDSQISVPVAAPERDSDPTSSARFPCENASLWIVVQQFMQATSIRVGTHVCLSEWCFATACKPQPKAHQAHAIEARDALNEPRHKRCTQPDSAPHVFTFGTLSCLRFFCWRMRSNRARMLVLTAVV